MPRLCWHMKTWPFPLLALCSFTRWHANFIWARGRISAVCKIWYLYSRWSSQGQFMPGKILHNIKMSCWQSQEILPFFLGKKVAFTYSFHHLGEGLLLMKIHRKKDAKWFLNTLGQLEVLKIIFGGFHLYIVLHYIMFIILSQL